MRIGSPIQIREMEITSPNQFDRVHIYSLGDLETDEFFSNVRALAFNEVTIFAKVSIEFEIVQVTP